MKSTIKMLEDRIHRVVERLREVTGERDRLRDELDDLRATLRDLEERVRLADLPAVNLPAALGEVDRAIRQAVRELGPE